MDIEKKLRKAIIASCLECSGGEKKMVELCNIDDCPLFPYRLPAGNGRDVPKSIAGGKSKEVKG